MKWHPLRFAPIFKERIWGGGSLARLYQRALPANTPIGESWEIADRPGDVSTVEGGELAGATLSELLAVDASGLMGEAPTLAGRFPLLVKILDARDVLSLQVHPPPHKAAALGGEPKTELWYFTGAGPDARILAGLRRGVTRAEFENGLASGSVETCFHSIPVRPGDAMFLPSGRVHALGAGVVLFEIQQNSDTTFRVFDWNRPGLDGRPRPLHVRESLECIDFTDFEPGLVSTEWRDDGRTQVRQLADGGPFRVESCRGPTGAVWSRRLTCCVVLGVVRGVIEVTGGFPSTRLGPGTFCLLPAALGEVTVALSADAEWLVVEPGGASSS